MRILVTFIVAAVLAFLPMACTQSSAPPPDHILVDPPPGSDLLSMSTYAGDALAANLWNRLRKEEVMVAVSLVNLTNLDDSSPFGLVAAQQIGSRLAQFGYSVVEGRLRQNIAFRVEEGEFMLTRDAARLMSLEYEAGAALVGCYTDTGSRVFVSVRVVRLADGVVIGAYEYYLPRQGDVATLLRKEVNGESARAFWSRYAPRQSAISP